jgi:signal transduction histidine kinase
MTRGISKRVQSLGLERGFLGAMIVISAILAVLQYHWTDRLAQAELAGQQTLLETRAQTFAQTFDRELSALCLPLIPSGRSIASQGVEAANLAAYRTWKTTNAPTIFSHVAILMPAATGLDVFEITPTQERLEQIAPPAAWAGLLADLRQGQDGKFSPYEDPGGVLLEFPVFASSAKSDGFPILQWTVLELNPDYVSKTWLPWLAGQFVDPASAEVRIETMEPEPRIIFSTGTFREDPAIRVPFNFQGHPAGSRLGVKNPVWQLEISPRTKELERAVYWSRIEGFTTALFLDLLILLSVYTLIRYTRREREVAEAQFNFVSATSHELRTPLTVIRGAAHNLERGIVRTPEGIRDYSNLIRTNAEQLTHMVEQVLAFAATQKARLSLSLRKLDLAEVVADSLAAVQGQIDQAAIRVDWPRGYEAMAVQGDAAALRRVFQNLLSNAIQHGGQGGWIGIVVGKDIAGRRASVTISDRGPGIPAAEREKIFEPFYRGAEAMARQTRGSGIGLSLVREIVAEHHGTIEIQSPPTGGASFVVHLPLDPAS